MGVAGGPVIISRLIDIRSRPPVIVVKAPVGVITAAAMTVIAVAAAISAVIAGAAAISAVIAAAATPTVTQPPVLDLKEGIVHLKTRLGNQR